MKAPIAPSKLAPTECGSGLRREIGLLSAVSLVIGCVVGSGIFVSSASMARNVGSGPMLLLIWALAGLFTLLGALTQCELVAQMPKSGGLYIYLREIYGDLTGFFYGWAKTSSFLAADRSRPSPIFSPLTSENS